MFLARTVEHTTDVQGMMERMAPSQYEQWQQYYKVEPWGDDWTQAGLLAAVFHNELTDIKAMVSGKAPKRDEYRDPADYVPGKAKKKPTKTRKQLLQESFTLLRQQAGV